MENKEEKNFRPASFSWFPGHMAKTRRQIEEDLKLVDVVVELLDARIPKSSQNPEIAKITKGKKKLIILNKCDLADEKENQNWVKYFAPITKSPPLSGGHPPTPSPACHHFWHRHPFISVVAVVTCLP